MKVEVKEVKITTYVFSYSEYDSLVKMGIWHVIRDRLKEHERIQIEQD
jgi:hypothetical protein